MNGHDPRKRPKELSGNTYKVTTGCGNLYVTINSDKEGLFEVFAHLGKSGQCGATNMEALCRSITAGLRSRVSPEVFVKQLKGIRCPNPIWDNKKQVLSCADAIGKVIEEEVKEKKSEQSKGKGMFSKLSR